MSSVVAVFQHRQPLPCADSDHRHSAGGSALVRTAGKLLAHRHRDRCRAPGRTRSLSSDIPASTRIWRAPISRASAWASFCARPITGRMRFAARSRSLRSTHALERPAYLESFQSGHCGSAVTGARLHFDAQRSMGQYGLAHADRLGAGRDHLMAGETPAHHRDLCGFVHRAGVCAQLRYRAMRFSRKWRPSPDRCISFSSSS